jgi:DNA-directed RNA polymerase specialized sigma24 family protein
MTCAQDWHVLREVLEFSAAEVAAQLGTTVTAVNSERPAAGPHYSEGYG